MANDKSDDMTSQSEFLALMTVDAWRQWQRIPESIPVDQQLCIIVEEFKHHSTTDLAVYYEDRSIFRQWQGFRQWPVEHVKFWMAIPEVPRG